jgi:hypothetical protein
MLPFLFAKKLNHGLPLNLRVAPIVTAIAADNEMMLYHPKHLCNAHCKLVDCRMHFLKAVCPFAYSGSGPSTS